MRTTARSMSLFNLKAHFPGARFSLGLLLGVVAWWMASLAGAATTNVTIKDDSFNPPSVTINPGDTVMWTNTGARTHTSTSGTGCTPDGQWNSGDLTPGATFSFTFPASGSFPYFCKHHCSFGMKGTVTVTGAAALSCTGSASPTSGTVPLNVTFTGSASGGTSPYTFAWTFGDSGTGSGASVSHTYATTGSFDWSLTVTDTALAACTKNGTITVSPAPSLSCTAGASPTSGNAPLLVNFSGSATGGTPAYTLAWTFGDGGSGSGTSVSHTYTTAGTFNWTLTVTDTALATCIKSGSIIVSSTAGLSCTAGAVPTSGSAPLLVGFTGSATGGSSPYTFAWDFGDSTFGSGTTLSHTYSTAGTFNWTLTVTDGALATCAQSGVVTVDSAVAYSIFLATGARATGAQNTNWKSDAMLFNAGSITVNYAFYYTPSGMDGTTTPYVFSGTVGPHAAPVLTNFVETLFGLTNSGGSVRIISDGELKLSSRTYNDTGSGTYGQWVPGQTLNDAIPPPTPSRATTPAELIGVNENTSYRSNIGFSEIGGLTASIFVNVFDGQNNPLEANFEVTLPPYGWVQLPLTAFGVSSGENLRVQIINQGPGTVLGYLSEVDNGTGDAIFVPAQKDGDVTGQTRQLVAVAAKDAGAFNTNWVSDLYLFNPLTQAQNVTAQYTAAQDFFNAAFAIEGMQIKAVGDVVTGLFPSLSGNSAGSLQILSDNGLIIVSRTYNQTDTGTYGQFVPAFNSDDPIGAGDTTYLLQVTNNADFRTNIGFSEYSGTDTQMSAQLYDSSGTPIAATTTPVTVPAGGNVQFTLAALFNLTASVDAGEVDVTVTSGGSVYPYLSVVDNRTGDAICVPGKK